MELRSDMSEPLSRRPLGPATPLALSQWLPRGADGWTLGLVAAGFALLYLPTWWGLAQTVWPTDEQGHGPIILAVSAWLIWRRREALAALPARPDSVSGTALAVLSLLLYVFGRSQSIWLFEVGSQVTIMVALLLLFRGWAGVRLLWFPLFFLLFMVPLPETLVAAVTTPLKSAVSHVGEWLLYALGYPVARSGVTLFVGPYQLLVADACAGLNSMFTLEALGLLYMNLMRHTNVARNITLAVLIIPISFVANVVRVMILVLVTFYAGDEAGQGFVHGFAGMVLFLVALVLIFGADALLGMIFRERRKAAAAAPTQEAAR
jgi:exosortase B